MVSVCKIRKNAKTPLAMLPEPTRHHPYRSSATSTPPHRTVSPSHHPFPTWLPPAG